jgi:oligopeptide transport system substrate-binding protein
VLQKNPHYWDKNVVAVETAEFYPTENLNTEERMFRNKQLDVTNEIPKERITTWQKDGTGAFHSDPYLGTYYYRINVTKPPFNDKRVRKALALAIDREKIVRFVTQGGEQAASAFTPPNTGGYTSKSILPTNLNRLQEAKTLLAEAGFPGGKGFPTVEILYNTHEGHKKTAEAVQQMWNKNLGIQVKILNQEWKVYLDSQATLNYQICRAAWIGDYNDPNTFLDMFVTEGGNNQTGWSNAEYDGLIAAAGKELDIKKRTQIFQSAENLLLEELPIIPVYIYRHLYLKGSRILGWYPNIEDIHPLKFVSIGPRSVAGGE